MYPLCTPQYCNKLSKKLSSGIICYCTAHCPYIYKTMLQYCTVEYSWFLRRWRHKKAKQKIAVELIQRTDSYPQMSPPHPPSSPGLIVIISMYYIITYSCKKNVFVLLVLRNNIYIYIYINLPLIKRPPVGTFYVYSFLSCNKVN